MFGCFIYIKCKVQRSGGNVSPVDFLHVSMCVCVCVCQSASCHPVSYWGLRAVCSVGGISQPGDRYPLFHGGQSLHHLHHFVPGTVHVVEREVVVKESSVGVLQVPRLSDHIVYVGLLCATEGGGNIIMYVQ